MGLGAIVSGSASGQSRLWRFANRRLGPFLRPSGDASQASRCGALRGGQRHRSRQEDRGGGRGLRAVCGPGASAALPDAKLVFIAIKPSVARWELWPQMQRANAQDPEDRRARHSWQAYADIASSRCWASDGKPRGELFVKDGLHLSEKGYRLWASHLRPLLK